MWKDFAHVCVKNLFLLAQPWIRQKNKEKKKKERSNTNAKCGILILFFMPRVNPESIGEKMLMNILAN